MALGGKDRTFSAKKENLVGGVDGDFGQLHEFPGLGHQLYSWILDHWLQRPAVSRAGTAVPAARGCRATGEDRIAISRIWLDRPSGSGPLPKGISRRSINDRSFKMGRLRTALSGYLSRYVRFLVPEGLTERYFCSFRVS